MTQASRPSLSTKKRRAIFEAHKGICHLCSQAIDPAREAWEVEHVRARALYRNPREADVLENMKPAHAKCHAPKTAEDNKRITKAKAQQNKGEGFKKAKRPLPGGKTSGKKMLVGGGVENRERSGLKRPLPPRRPLYE